MSRLHSGRRGASASKKPLMAPIPAWVQYKPEEITSLVVKLAKQGHSTADIGNILRDSYGIPDVQKITGKKIAAVLAANKLSAAVPEDLQALLKRAINAKKHAERNKNDTSSKRGLQLIEAKMRRLIKYYKSSGRLPQNWSYELVG